MLTTLALGTAIAFASGVTVAVGFIVLLNLADRLVSARLGRRP